MKKNLLFLIITLIVFGFFWMEDVKADTATFYSTASDGSIDKKSYKSWNDVHDAANGDKVWDSADDPYGNVIITLGKYWSGYGTHWEILRGFLFFDTSSLGPCEITDAKLYFYWNPSDSDTPHLENNSGFATLHIVEGVQHDPLQLSDYGAELNKTTSGGSISFNSWSSGYNQIALNATGRNWVNPIGMTKFCTRLAGDINDINPYGENYAPFYSSEKGSGYRPKLVVTYTPSINQSPSISSVTDSPDPVTAGNSITFTANWSDPDSGDQTKLHICKTNSISGQTCPGGNWCNTTSWDTTSPSSCSYTTGSGDVGSRSYYAFVCDDDNACSSSVSGTFTVEAAISLPTVTTDIADVNLQNNTATLKGNITDTGGENCSERGFEWGTSTASYPNSWTETGNYATGTFSHQITLSPGTIYYYRAKAHNAAGWGYGAEGQFVIYTASGGQKQFTTLPSDTTPPTTKIKIIRTSTGEDVTAVGYWLRADTYTIEFEDGDNIGGSGLKSCEYYINSCDVGGTNCTTPVVSLTARNHNWSFDITAGKTAPIYNLEGAGRYYIYSGVTDNADNSGIDYKYLNFDFTPPETRIE